LSIEAEDCPNKTQLLRVELLNSQLSASKEAFWTSHIENPKLVSNIQLNALILDFPIPKTAAPIFVLSELLYTCRR
jgi:hypothetical protein